MKLRKATFLLMASHFITQAALAGHDAKCQIIHWQPSHVYTIDGEINSATHIIFPVSKAVDPVVGNSELWHVESAANHVYLKPTDKNTEEGANTTLSFIGEDNQSYEFHLHRTDKESPECVLIQRDGSLLGASWAHYQSPNQKLLNELIKEVKQSQRSRSNVVAQQRKAMSDYRSHIFTNYTWRNQGHWKARLEIDSVYDDGRWTYIRLKNDENGLMSLHGIVSGYKELLQYKYDSQNHIYRVAGVYPRLLLSYDNNSIEIKRLG